MRSCLVVVVLFLTACSTSSWLRRAKATIKTPTTTLTQVGDVAVPANVTTTTTKTEAPIPPGSKITIETPQVLTPTPGDYGRSPLPIMSQTVHTEQITAPTSFTPPVGPTLSDQTDSTLKLWSWIGVIIGAVAGIFGLVRGWNLVAIGGACVASACLIALFIHAYPWLFILIGLGVGLKFAGPYIWHTQIKPTLTPNVPPTT